MPDTQLKKAARHVNPPPTAADLLECVQSHDLGVKAGKQALWRLINRLPLMHRAQAAESRDKYLEQRFTVGEANRLAALDLAAMLPTVGELPEGLLESLKPLVPGGRSRSFKKEDRPEPAADATAPAAEQSSAPRRRVAPLLTRLDEMVAQVRALTEDNPEWKRVALAANIRWVTSELLTPFDAIEPETIPSLWALTTLRYAKQNETEYRRLYDSKIVPVKGIAEDDEKALVDTGAPIDDIMGRLEEAGEFEGPGVPAPSVSGESHVSMRHLQAAESDGDDAGSSGGVHGLPECPVERREGGDPGEAGGPGGGADGRSGAVLHGSPPSGGGSAGDDPSLSGVATGADTGSSEPSAPAENDPFGASSATSVDGRNGDPPGERGFPTGGSRGGSGEADGDEAAPDATSQEPDPGVGD